MINVCIGTVAAADGVRCARVRLEINFLLTFETALFFCVYPVYIIVGDCIVGITTRYRLHGSGFKPRRSREISLLHTRLNRLWDPTSLMYNATGGSLPGVERQGCDLVHPPHLVLRSRPDAAITVFVLCAFSFYQRATAPPVGQGLLIVEASRSHSDTPHSVGRLWTGDQPDPETAHNIHKRQTSMPPVEFEPTIPASERPQIHGLDRATGIG